MPIYEYRCTHCGHEAEVLQKLSAPPLTDCPRCSRPSLVKLVSAAGFQLKGTGWYATDFRGSGSAKPKDDKPAADGGTDTKAPATTESAAAPACGAGACPSCQ